MYLIIGANGFLGAYMMQKVLEKTEQDIIAVTRNVAGLENTDRIKWMSCDIALREDVDKLAEYVNKIKEKVNVIYLAAYHHPDLVEKNPRLAWSVNITALSYFMNVVENIRCFIYPSTDSVYGEGDSRYHFKERDELHPVNLYGHHKAAAECLVNTYGYNVVRFPFLIAPSLLSHKKHFYDQIVDTICSGDKMEMFSDSMRSSLDFGTAADLTIELVENYREDMPHILNVSGDEDLSKYDIGIMIAKKIGVSPELIVPISASKTEGIFEAKRAQSTLLDNTEVKNFLGLEKIMIQI